jgi:hypothetical protein
MFSFHNAQSPDELFAILENFIEFWCGQRKPEYGVPEQLLKTVPLPCFLKRLYAFAGKWPNLKEPEYSPMLFGIQDQLVPFEQLKFRNNRVYFLDVNQNGCTVFAEIGKPDPSVFHETWHHATQTTCPQYVDTLSRFLITYCLQELVFGATYDFYCEEEGILEVCQEFGFSVELLWKNGQFLWGEEDTRTYYLCNQQILLGRWDNRECAGYFTMDEALKRAMKQKFPLIRDSVLWPQKIS